MEEHRHRWPRLVLRAYQYQHRHSWRSDHLYPRRRGPNLEWHQLGRRHSHQNLEWHQLVTSQSADMEWHLMGSDHMRMKKQPAAIRRQQQRQKKKTMENTNTNPTIPEQIIPLHTHILPDVKRLATLIQHHAQLLQ